MPWQPQKDSGAKEEYKKPKYFQRKVILAFERYIMTSGLPRSDKLLLADMVCRIAPMFNKYFDREKFLSNCGLIEPKKEGE